MQMWSNGDEIWITTCMHTCKHSADLAHCSGFFGDETLLGETRRMLDEPSERRRPLVALASTSVPFRGPGDRRIAVQAV